MTWHASATRSRKGSNGVSEKATPTGVIRIAAPLVAPALPASSGGTPRDTASRAALVEGPSRSNEPLAFMARSHSRSSCASRSGSIRPPDPVSSRPTMTA
ncbi:hypothetical protein GCM10009680_39820 [Streptomyces yatensis]|uniref:Uncharacterized protein n=1 Tax=Streptomyces yatensis TaxID=155177 RepID=A0ABN2HZ60_9ACTN